MNVAPKHVWLAIQVITAGMVNATNPRNRLLYAELFLALRGVCLRAIKAGARESLLYEVLGDFSINRHDADKYYRRAALLADTTGEAVKPARKGFDQYRRQGLCSRQSIRSTYQTLLKKSMHK